MSNSAKSLYVFGIYLTLFGTALLVAPNAVLTLFAYETTREVWIRVVGMLMFLLSFYYIQAARHELHDFIRWSVYTRASVIVFIIAFVVTGLARPVLMVVGVTDLVGALWTAAALRSSRRPRS